MGRRGQQAALPSCQRPARPGGQWPGCTGGTARYSCLPAPQHVQGPPMRDVSLQAASCRTPSPPTCSTAHTPLVPCSQFVEDPYTKARFQPDCAGQVSPVGDLSKVGLEASGLVSSPTQLR